MAKLMAVAICTLAFACGSKQAPHPADPQPTVADHDDVVDDAANGDDDDDDDDDAAKPEAPAPAAAKWSLEESGVPIADVCAQVASVHESDGCKGLDWAEDKDTCLASMASRTKAIGQALDAMGEDEQQDDWDVFVDWANCLDEADDCDAIAACGETYKNASSKPFGK